MKIQNMTSTIKRSMAHGFTLIELLIVVIILAILAAIAIPQFSASTSDAQMAALDSNLSAVRTALEQYKVQHTGNVYPGSAAAGACATGTAQAVGKPAMIAQLSSYTNAAGDVCPTGDAVNYKYGPYLRQGIPVEPFTSSNEVAVVTTAPIVGDDGGNGWAYNATTGQFVKNDKSSDGSTGDNARTFAQH